MSDDKDAKDKTTDDDRVRTLTYMHGYRNGMSKAIKMLNESAASIRLHAGEMTAQEMRCVQAVLAWKCRQIWEASEAAWKHVENQYG